MTRRRETSRRWRADAVPPVVAAAEPTSSARWPVPSNDRWAMGPPAPLASVLAHGAVLVAVLRLAGAPPSLPPALPEAAMAMVFVGSAAATAPTAEPPPTPPPESPVPASTLPPLSRPTPPPASEPAPIPPLPAPPPRPVFAPKPATPRAALPRRRPPTTDVVPGSPPLPATPAVQSAPGPAPAAPPPAAVQAAPVLLGGMSGQCLAAYPDRLRRREVQGKVMIRVHIAADGAPETASVVTSSGSEDLDRLALAAVRACHSLPKASAAYDADIPYHFILTN